MISFSPSKERLGNQMFRYVFMRKTAERLGVAFHFEKWEGDLIFSLNDDNIRATGAEDPSIQKAYHPRTHSLGFDEQDLHIEDGALIHGYFQSWRYCDPPERIRQWFQFREEVVAPVIAKYRHTDFAESCGIHFRCGDIKPKPHRTMYHYIPRRSYYQRALEIVQKKQNLLIFSDDMKSAREFFNFLGESAIFMEGNRDYQDLYLLSQCGDLICSPSTFSWWGAFLNLRVNKRVVVPREGSLRPNQKFIHRDYWPQEWTQIRSLWPLWDTYETQKLLAPFSISRKRRFLAHSSITHVYGPRKVKCNKDEVIVICRVKNGAIYLKTFLEHYLRMGVKHIVFLDNGSEDGTPLLAKKYPKVTVLSTRHRVTNDIIHFENYLMRRFCMNRWCLNVDIDELFDYPHSNEIPLKAFLGYLNQNKYTAVVGQMLDMFSEKSLSEVPDRDPDFRANYRYYDISQIERENYLSSRRKGINNSYNSISNPNIHFHWGGIRYGAFKTKNGLTKHPLVFVKRNTKKIHGHCVRDVRCADISAVLFHFPFNNFYQKAKQYCETGFGAVPEYQAYLKVFQQHPNFMLRKSTAQELKCVNELVENGFLSSSPQYNHFVKGHLPPPNL